MLSAHEKQVLAEIEEGLGNDDPALAASLRTGRAPSAIRREVPFWTGQLWVLTLLLAALALHPLVVGLGVLGVGLLTVGLVLPWLWNAARSAGSPERGAGAGRRSG